jgi:hypothetical protein
MATPRQAPGALGSTELVTDAVSGARIVEPSPGAAGSIPDGRRTGEVGSPVASLRQPSWQLVTVCNDRDTAEQWIKEGKNAVKWTRLSCHDLADNQVRLQLFALAYNLGNFLRRLALPRSVKHWSLTTLREKLIKIGAKVVTHARYVIFQLAEVAVPKRLFRAILARIRRLRLPETVPG